MFESSLEPARYPQQANLLSAIRENSLCPPFTSWLKIGFSRKRRTRIHIQKDFPVCWQLQVLFNIPGMK